MPASSGPLTIPATVQTPVTFIWIFQPTVGSSCIHAGFDCMFSCAGSYRESRNDPTDTTDSHCHSEASRASSPFSAAIFLGSACRAHLPCACAAVRQSSFFIAVAVIQC